MSIFYAYIILIVHLLFLNLKKMMFFLESAAFKNNFIRLIPKKSTVQDIIKLYIRLPECEISSF